jgi:glycosyltransferase involved in cell wall biosynthesis
MPPPAEEARVLAILPARNEAEALPRVLASLREHGISEAWVVDNGSTDATAEVARAAGARVLQTPVPGYGRACLCALDVLRAMAPRPDILLFLDADGSDDPAAIPALTAPLRSGRADLTIGVRMGHGDAPLRQRGGTRLVVTLARWLHRIEARDLGPFRAVRTEALLALDMDDLTWGWTLQMQIRAHRAGLRVVEVPVSRRPRLAGVSKISGSFWMSVRVGGRMFWTLLRELGWRPRSQASGPETAGSP